MLTTLNAVTALAASADAPAFIAAKPVWIEGRETEKNLSLVFEADIPGMWDEAPVLRITASTLYRAKIGGTEFIGHGPARGPHARR